MTESNERAHLSGKKILIIDDHADFVYLASTFLRGSGAEVSTATSGAAALWALEINEIDLIVMDLQMPHIDGWQSAKMMRERGFLGKLIACSARYFYFNGLDKSDFDGYIPKPITRHPFLDCLAHELSSSKTFAH